MRCAMGIASVAALQQSAGRRLGGPFSDRAASRSLTGRSPKHGPPPLSQQVAMPGAIFDSWVYAAAFAQHAGAQRGVRDVSLN